MIAARKAKVRRNVPYGLLASPELIIDASGLSTGVNNAYGDIDGSNAINSIKSLAPGPTGRDFTINGTTVAYDPTDKSISFGGSGRLRSTGAASLFNFMSYHASGYASIKWTAFMVCKIGTTIKPASASYGLYGNNGASSVSKGVAVNYANNTTNEDTLTGIVTKGTATNFLGRTVVPGSAPSNRYCVVTFQFDGAASAGVRTRLYINDQAILAIEQLNNDTTPVNTPTYVFEIGSSGNAVTPFIGNVKELIIASEAVSYTNSISIIRALMNKHGIINSRVPSYLNVSKVPEVFLQDSAANYKLCGIIGQNPIDKNEVCAAYSVGGSHLYNADKKLVVRVSPYKSAPYATSFGSEVTVLDPANPSAIQDCGGGYDSNGVMHLFADVINSGTAGGCIAAYHCYSSDLASWTNTDITGSLHSDGLLCWRMYGNMIHVSGVWIKPYYKQTDQGDTTQSANYILRSTDGVNWTSVTVRAAASTYINESSVFWAGGDNIGYLSRNESTGEWSISMSADLGQTWSAMSAVTFGETVVSANPPMTKTFTHNGVLVCVAYITNRNNDTAFAVYGKASSIVSDPVNGWDLGTKVMWFKTGLAPWHYHYGDVAHLDDTINAVGLYPYDNFPGAGGTTNRLNFTVMPTWYAPLIESELGI